MDVTYVYGFNGTLERGNLRSGLANIAQSTNFPWMILRDFNNVWFHDNRIGVVEIQVCDFHQEFHECNETYDKQELKWIQLLL